MQFRKLGRTDLLVSEIGLGTYKNLDVKSSEGQLHCDALVEKAVNCGVNFFDTAPMYGRSEEVLGNALYLIDKKCIYASKVLESNPRDAKESIERTLKRLQVDTIDLMQIHNMSSWRQVAPVLEEFRKEGKVRFLGVTDYRISNYSEVLTALKTGVFDTVQIPYYLGEKTCKEMLFPIVRDLNLGVIVMTPISPIYARGTLIKKLCNKDLSFLKEYGVTTPGQALLKYLLSDSNISTIIPATSKIERIVENTNCSNEKKLDKDSIERLEFLLEES
tara:strand:- start:2712 stop:3536 length:825 start_codon:yes stop_codon:yes gene_type:complete